MIFTELDPETQGELWAARAHLEAGDQEGAFAHLIQFAAWAAPEAKHANEAWEKYGPHGPHKAVAWISGKFQVIG